MVPIRQALGLEALALANMRHLPNQKVPLSM
jgi:hypothetical protein